jgi:rRNA small subunit pseudouridine methyltransferase Nep1
MLSLSNAEKRGRPDIAHITLLQILSSPLNKEGRLRSFVHTINDDVIQVDGKTRLPRNYDRFVNLIEQLFVDRRVPPQGDPLLTVKKSSIQELLETVQPSVTVAFSSIGTPTTMRNVCRDLARERFPTVLIGGFAHGHFSKTISDLADMVVSIYHEPLDAWVVASRVVYEYEVESKMKERV